MAHELYQRQDGSYAYMGRLPAWHTLGKVTGKFMTSGEILANGMDWRPEKRQLMLDGKLVDCWCIVRSDTGEVLGAVGADYTPIPHHRGLEGVDLLMGEIDGAHYETAGELGKGERVWVQANLKINITVGLNDEHKLYLLFATSHNASMSFSYWLTDTRAVCANTVRIATAAAASLRVKHTKNANQRINDAHKALATIQGEAKTMEEKLNFLATRKVDKPTLLSVLDKLFPKGKDDEGKPVESVHRNNILIDVLTRYESNDGNMFPEQRGTAYNLLNAITEYTDHSRGSDAKRAESAMFGSGERLKSQAMEVLVQTASGLVSVPTTQYVVDRKPINPGLSLLDQVVDNHAN